MDNFELACLAVGIILVLPELCKLIPNINKCGE